MKIYSENDKSYVKNLVEPYSLDLILTRCSKETQEIGSNFLMSFDDLKYHPCVIKDDGAWGIFNQRSAEKNTDDKDKLGNIYEITYLNVIQRIKFIQRLNDEHLIFSTSDIKKIMKINKNNFIQRGRKIEDNEICAFLDEYQNKKIYPTDELIRMYNNKFKTTDEIRYNRQVKISTIGIIVAILSALSSLYLNKCTSTKIDNKEMNTVIVPIKQQ